MTAKVNTSIRVDARLLSAAKTAAAEKGQSFATFIERALVVAVQDAGVGEPVERR